MKAKIERNFRLYRAHMHGVSLSSLAQMEHISPTRVYQIITAVEYQLKKNNPDYMNEYNSIERRVYID